MNSKSKLKIVVPMTIIAILAILYGMRVNNNHTKLLDKNKKVAVKNNSNIKLGDKNKKIANKKIEKENQTNQNSDLQNKQSAENKQLTREKGARNKQLTRITGDILKTTNIVSKEKKYISQKNNNKYISLNKTYKANELNENYYDNLVSMNPMMAGEQSYNDIDENIYSLEYDPVKILSSNGEKIENFRPAEGFENPDKYIVVKREKKSISDSTADIAVIDSMNDRTYPGAIQLANRNLIENKPDIISCNRKPIKISVDLPGMSKDGIKNVKNPTYSSVKSAVNSLLDTWNTRYSKKYTIPTRVSYSDSMVYSKSQISTAFGCNLKQLNKELKIDFDAIFKGQKKVMLIAYKQIFYTVNVDAPNKPSDLFADNVMFNDLKVRGVNKDNPPAYVSSVQYGRTIYVKLETTSKSSNVKAAFKALINKQDIHGNAEYKDILNQSSFTATVLGGGAEQHNKVVTKNFDEIREVIKNNAVYGPKNPGYPIAYTTTFLKNNAVATIKNKTDYIETTSTEYTNSKIALVHRGGYVAQFDISWDEVKYDKNGKEILEHKTWAGNYQDRTSPFNTEIQLKGNARNVCVKIRECTGLAWEWWRTIVDVKNIPLVKKRTFSIWGTTLYPATSIVEE